MIYTCSEPFLTTTDIRCTGSAVPVSEATSSGNYSLCSIPFELNNSGRLSCYGSVSATSDILNADPNLFLFSADLVPSTNDRFTVSSDINSFLVSDYQASIPVNPEPPNNGEYTGFTAAEYSNLISIALPSLVLAFSFKMIYRLIMNR